MTNPNEKGNILLVEILENDLDNIGVPFTLYGVVSKSGQQKIRALYAVLKQQRADIVKTYESIDKCWKAEQDG